MATMVQFLSNLNSCKQQAVFWHNQVEGPGSYSAHKTLNAFYDGILDLLDDLVESYAGVYGRPKGYEAHEFEDFKDLDQVRAYFKEVYTYIQTERKGLPQETWIQNIVDEIAALTAQTSYLLSLA
jgi:DNA-binding ferritin-like protein